jgi:ABC-type protease/lipase transport system fused ATPase/permease subunit
LFLFAGLFSLAINLLLLVPPLYMLQVFDRVLASRSGETLAVLTIAALTALVVMALLEVLRARLLAAAGAALDQRLGPRVLDGLLAQTARLSGSAYLNGLRDVNTLRSFLGGAGLTALFDAPWLPIFLLVIFLFHPVLGIVAVLGGAAMVTLAVLNERFTRAPIARSQAEARRAGRFIDANVRNAEVVSALGMLPAVTQRWAGLNDAALAEQMRASRIGGAFTAGPSSPRQFIQMRCSRRRVPGGGAGRHRRRDDGDTILLGRALAPVEALVAGWRSLVEAKNAWRRLSELLGANPQAEARTELPAPTGQVELEGVAFRLDDKVILRGISFRLPAGESLGLIGPSASGKSTLARLIVGVWKAGGGVVRLDGADVRRGRARSSGRISATCRRTWSCSAAPSPRTSRAWDARRHRSGARRAARACPRPVLRLPKATTPRSAKTASRSRRASASASGSRAPCTATPAWWCWTSPMPTSTTKARKRCSARSTCSRRTASRWW